MQAELIINGAQVLTMDETRPRAEAVAIAGGRIVAVGSDAEVMALAGPGTQVIDAGGRTLLPGFVESHLHLGLGGLELEQLQLGGMMGWGAVKAAFDGYAAAHPEMKGLFAQGTAYGVFGADTTRQDLDRIIADRPIALMSPDHHTVWANTMALEQSGLLHGAAMPHGHQVVMAADGTASGELREFEAFGPVVDLAGNKRMNLGIATGAEPAVPSTAAERAADKAHFRRGLAHCARHGITTAVSMDGNRYALELLAEIEAEGGLTARCIVPFHMKPDMDMGELDRASAMARDFGGEWLRSGFVKMFMDGVVDSRTAYMLQDYPGVPEHRSEPLFEPERFKDICAEVDRRGLQIAVHAIGDGAVRVTIDGYEAARVRNGPRDSRHRIEHIELIDRADVPRLAALGITASVQPSHPPGAMDFPMDTMDMVYHRERWRDAYLTRTLVEAGAPLAFASDWPVTDIDVMRSLQASQTRAPYDGCQDERVGLMDALRAYTAGGARAVHWEGLTGTLKPGLAGDLVLVDGDVEATLAADLGGLGIALTVAGGRITHRGAGFG